MNPSSEMSGPDQSEEALFEAALRYATPAERAAWLDQACAGQPERRRRVERLLAAHDKAGAFLDNPAAANRPTIRLSAPAEESLGTVIGRYKLLEKVGEGGFGAVYVAEQREPVKRRVALKIIKLGMDTRQIVARFEAERQALALMDHPNIAKVLDAGATDAGRPYFVMELVRGIKVTEYCDQHRLSTRDRLELFIQICHAIQHAHQKGIIHRDIKPSNILVTLHDGLPVPKVIDFGIAKATQQELTDKTLYTQLQQFIGTPAYMSPEQAEMSGLDIDTRSDIYSLGVLLYELLTGRTPFDPQELMKAGVEGMRKTIREQEPVRPSTKVNTLQGEELTTTARCRGTEAPKLISLLRGDLDWIVMKCLEKDRTRRYETANGLAMDLNRHLNDEAIIARPPSSAYRFQKLVQRNKLVFAAGGAVAAALVIGLGVSIFLYVKENEAYNRAVAARLEADAARENELKQHQLTDAARSQAEGLVTFMIQDLEPMLSEYGRLPLLKQVAEKAVGYFDGLPPDLRDTSTELGRANAIEALAEILQASGDKKSAEAKWRETLALYQRLAEKHPELPEAAAAVLMVQWQLTSLGPPQSSAELDTFQQDIVRQWRELIRKYPDNFMVRRGWTQALFNRGFVAAVRFNKPQEAIRVSLELQDGLRQTMASEPENKLLPAIYANSLTLLATAYDAAGEREKSRQLSEEAMAYFDKTLQDDPGNLRLLADSANAARFLSYRVSPVSMKRARDAELIARERYRTLTALDPANAGWRHDYAWVHLMECYYLEAEGQNEAARAAFKKFDSLLQPVATDDNDREKLMTVSFELARLAALTGDAADARAQLAAAEARFQTHNNRVPAGSFDRVQASVRSLNLESEVLFTLRDWPELARVAREMLAAIDEGLLQKSGESELRLRRAVAQGFLGVALLRQGNPRDALPVLQQSVAGHRETPAAAAFTEDRESYATIAVEALAEALADTGDVRQARSLWESALAIHESKLAKQPDLWELKKALANSLVLLAGVLDPSNAEDAVRRQSLLDRAAALLNSPEVQNRLTADDREVKAKIDSLRAGAATKPGH